MDDNNLFPRLDKIEKNLEALLDREEPTLKYKIETSDKQDHYMAFHGSDFWNTLWDLKEEIHDVVHHERAEEMGLDPETLDWVLDLINEYMEDHGVDFNHVG